MVGAAEQHAQIPSTPGTAIGVGFCAAALAFTLSEFALWAFSRAGRCPSHSPACVPPRYNVWFTRYHTLRLTGLTWSLQTLLYASVRHLMAYPATTSNYGPVQYRFKRYGSRYCRLSMAYGGTLSFFNGSSFSGPSFISQRAGKGSAPDRPAQWISKLWARVCAIPRCMHTSASSPAQNVAACEYTKHPILNTADEAARGGSIYLLNFDQSYRASHCVRVCRPPLTATMAQSAIRMILLAHLLAPISAADTEPSKLPRFDGGRATFRQWLLAFTAYISLKYPDLVGILDNSVHVLRPGDDAEQAERDRYRRLTRQRYGAIVQCCPSWLMSSLNHIATQAENRGNEGRITLDHLHAEFGSTTALDRTSAISRLHLCHFNAKAAMDVNHLRYQYSC